MSLRGPRRCEPARASVFESGDAEPAPADACEVAACRRAAVALAPGPAAWVDVDARFAPPA